MLKNKDIQNLPKELWVQGLKELPQPPEKLNIRGLENYIKLKEEGYVFLCIVGSRNHTTYGTDACIYILEGLKDKKICIVSGLAYGIDTVAHMYAMENNLPTIAFPGSGLNEKVIYPRGRVDLAEQILEKGGCLISEFENDTDVRPYLFRQRNRLMAGMCDAVLVIEASEKSGSVITANYAVEYNKELMVVPGSIFNIQSEATNRYCGEGATVVRSSEDILKVLN